jgi:hypothetical protein
MIVFSIETSPSIVPYHVTVASVPVIESRYNHKAGLTFESIKTVYQTTTTAIPHSVPGQSRVSSLLFSIPPSSTEETLKITDSTPVFPDRQLAVKMVSKSLSSTVQ